MAYLRIRTNTTKPQQYRHEIKLVWNNGCWKLFDSYRFIDLEAHFDRPNPTLRPEKAR